MTFMGMVFFVSTNIRVRKRKYMWKLSFVDHVRSVYDDGDAWPDGHAYSLPGTRIVLLTMCAVCRVDVHDTYDHAWWPMQDCTKPWAWHCIWNGTKHETARGRARYRGRRY